LVVVALAQQDLDLALQASEQALQLAPESVSARFNYSVALQRARYTLDAAEQLEQVARMQPGNASVHLALANLYRVELTDINNARRHYERVLSIQPQHPRAAEIRRILSRGY
jgi:tetratricopeptide (TPR) repeat protein